MTIQNVSALHCSEPGPLVRQHFSSSTWIEGKAIDQLNDVSKLDGVTVVSAFPDLHPGKYGPIGIALASDRLYPLLIGNDIGCGMTLFALDTPVRKLNAEKAAARLRSLEGAWSGDAHTRLEEVNLEASLLPASLGTIGGGNHFCELQALNEVLGPEKLDRDIAYLLVHSGSRGLGNDILARLAYGSVKGIDPQSEAGTTYLRDHDLAVRWALLNRQVIAERAAALLGCELQLVCDAPHNLVEWTNDGWVHRKGSAKATGSLVPVAGSRATLSYVVQPGPNIADSLQSFSHGAGRKYDRASMLTRVGKTKSDRQALQRNKWGGRIVCEDRQLLLEEAPEAYKDAGQVVDDLASLGLALPVASFRPVVTFKRAGDGGKEDFRQKDKARDIERRKERRGER